MTTFNINIVSDPICPFCYLGKKRLDRAIDVYKKTIPGGSQDTFNINWKPYYLDPTLPPGKGIPSLERYTQKFGADRLEGLKQRLNQMGEPEGIRFAFSGKMGNTRDAHRLVQLARTKGGDVQSKVMAELMKSYFEGTGDITQHEMLLEAGEKAGLDRAEAKSWLEEGKGGAEVDEEVEWAYAKGIRGVPHFIINDRFEVGGAQEVDAFLLEFVKAREARESGQFQASTDYCT